MVNLFATVFRPILKLRILLPILIGLLSVTATTMSFYANQMALKDATIQTVTNNIKDSLTRTQGVIELIINTNQASAIRKIIASFSAQPDMLLTIVTDNRGTIIASTTHLFMETQWQDHRLAIDPNIVNRIINERSVSIKTAIDQNSIEAFISICPRVNQIVGQLRNNKCSFLMQRVDLNYHIHQASQLLKRQAIYTSLSTIVLACFIGFFLHMLFAKRSQKLANTVQAFTQGQRKVRSQISGQDEISLIAVAVDQMLNQIERNEIELTSEKNRLNALFNTVVDPIVVTDGNGVISSCNNATCSVFNYSEHELMQRSIYTLLPELFEIQSQNTVGLFNLSAKRLNAIARHGRVFPIELSTNQMEIDGNVEQITIMRDITERVHAETELKQHRDNLKQLVDIATTEIQAIVQTAVNAVITIDKFGNIQIFNPAAEKMFGWRKKEVFGKNVSILMPDIDKNQHNGYIQNYLMSGQAKIIGTNREIIAKRKDNSTFPAHLSVGHSQLNDDKHLFVAFISDITSQKAAEQELLNAKEKAEQAANTKAEFMANMSHEIRTPMNAIIGFSEIMLQDKKLSNSSQQFAMTILDAGKTLLRIINDILDFTKIEAGKLVIEKVPFDLPSTIQSATQMLAISAEQKQLKLTIDIAPDIPQHVIGDPTRLRQVLTNLLGNAIKFTNQGEITTSLITDNDTNVLQFAVKDSGIGMNEQQIKTIFDPFAQGDSSTNRRFGGTGLGTTISKEIVELMGGQMWVQSKPNHGSTFYFTVYLPPADDEQKSQCVNEQTNIENLPPLRILLTENVAANAQLIIIKLEKMGHQVVWVTNGQAAIDQIMDAGFDLVLMDIQMPQVDGQTFTRAIREYEKEHKVNKRLPIIALTAQALKDKETECIQAGVDLIITKPINFNQLFEAMAQLVCTNTSPTSNPFETQQPIQLNHHQKEQAKQALDQLLIALEKLNPDYCQLPLERIERVLDKQLLSAIRSTIDEFDFASAKELTKSLANQIDRMNQDA